MTRSPSSFNTQDECSEYHRLQQETLQAQGAVTNGSYIKDSWCPASFDDFLCWPPSPPSIQSLQCPPIKGADPSSEY
ncbi:GPCR family 2 extracellular hormone receptor domain [Trinorchestia longiramus]|nr:GPCR family 2 extracellular hormone receptor domain [Trinorchestia longiramus]